MINSYQRGDRLREIATRLKLKYAPTDQWGIEQQLQDFRLFRRGFRGRLRHVMSLEDGLLESRVYIFDYRYLKWAGKSTRRVQQTVFFLESRQLGLPEFYMRPEYFFHRVGEMLGITDDIDFEEHFDFSNNYRLTGEDEDFVRHNFREDVLRFFAIEKGWSLEGLGYYLILYKRGKILAPDKINDIYLKGMKVYEGLKS